MLILIDEAKSTVKTNDKTRDVGQYQALEQQLNHSLYKLATHG